MRSKPPCAQDPPQATDRSRGPSTPSTLRSRSRGTGHSHQVAFLVTTRAGGPITQLDSKQRAHLRSLAHHLKPILQVGAEGVSDPFVRSLTEVLRTHELLKVKVLSTAPEGARATADLIVAALPEVQVAQTIGRTVVLYRPFPEEPEIALPR